MKILNLVIPLSLSLLFLVSPARVGGVGSEKFKKEEELVRISMLQMSRELGVTCTECHSTSNFKDSSKPQFKVALEHSKIVEVLKREGMDGKLGPEASCFMCHKGKLKFVHKMTHPESKN
jgi:hypothetical protein